MTRAVRRVQLCRQLDPQPPVGTRRESSDTVRFGVREPLRRQGGRHAAVCSTASSPDRGSRSRSCRPTAAARSWPASSTRYPRPRTVRRCGSACARRSCARCRFRVIADLAFSSSVSRSHDPGTRSRLRADPVPQMLVQPVETANIMVVLGDPLGRHASLLRPTKSARSSQVWWSRGESGLLGELVDGLGKYRLAEADEERKDRVKSGGHAASPASWVSWSMAW